MKFHELQAYDEQLGLVWPSTFEEEIEGITNIDWPKPGHMLFVKTFKFYKQLKNLIDKNNKDYLQVGIIFDKNLFHSKIEEENVEIDFLTKSVAFIGLSATIDLSISLLSKPFYDQIFDKLDLFSDGLVSKNVTISQTAQVAKEAFIGEGVIIGNNVKIMPHATIMAGSSIGDNCIIFPQVTIYPLVSIGQNCRIHAHTTIGADGFGYNFDKGVHHKIWHIGGVIIEDDVEIGASAAVDSGAFSPTVIGKGSKLDNFVQIGHNARIGTGVIFCGQAGLSGSNTVGDFSVFGGRAGTGSNLTIGPRSQIAGGALINCDWPAGSVVGGHPARPLNEWMRGLAYVRKESLIKKS